MVILYLHIILYVISRWTYEIKIYINIIINDIKIYI